MLRSLAPLALALTPLVGGDEAAFDRGLESARGLARTERWPLAERELRRLLDTHADQPYVLPHLRELVDLLQRSSFFQEYRPSAPGGGTDGEVVAWNERTGELTLRYRELGPDFRDDGEGARLHSVEFEGPYRVEATGTLGAAPRSLAETPRLPQLLVGVRGSESYQVVFGLPHFEVGGSTRWIPPRILFNGEREVTVLAQASATPLTYDRRYALTVLVDEDCVRASFAGAPLLEAPKPRGVFGRVAILDLPGLEELTLAGVVSPAWLGRRADEERDRAWRTYLARWDPRRELPAWAAERLDIPEGAAAPGSFRWPIATEQAPLAARIVEHYAAGRTTAGLAELDALAPGSLAPELEAFLRGLLLLAADRPTEALASLDVALRAAPAFTEARVLRGRALGELGRGAECLEVLRETSDGEDAPPLAWTELARWQLRFGQSLEARQTLDRALAVGVPPSALAELEGLLVRALGGPVWERTHEYRSRHYTVRSDSDRQVCFDAAQTLEAALRFYQQHLGRLGSRGTRRSAYPVYVFSGRAGYQSYAGDLFGEAPESTAGLYSPMLGQLLVWNPHEGGDLDRTLRHEGLHQYLDASLGFLPAWLNEGMAEYFEVAEVVRGVPALGAVQTEHVALLTAPEFQWLPYAELFELRDTEFYTDALPKYAQSWALIHWLHHSGKDRQRLFRRVLDDLARGIPVARIHAALLELGDLEASVGAHVRALRRD